MNNATMNKPTARGVAAANSTSAVKNTSAANDEAVVHDTSAVNSAAVENINNGEPGR